MKKRVIAALLAIVLVLSCGSAELAYATEFTEEEMSEKVLYVKNLFDIGDEFTDFSSDVYSYGEKTYWTYYWSWNNGADVDYKYRNINVRIDDKNRIQEYYTYSSIEESKLPTKSADKYESKVTDFISEIAPEIAGHIRLTNTSCNFYGNTYYYYFIRSENGIDMPDNSVSVYYNYVTNEVTEFLPNWTYDLKIPSSEKIITKEEAASKLSKDLTLELQYMTRWNDGKEEAFLVYAPSRSYLAVDAISGKVYTKKYYYDTDDVYGSETTADMAPATNEEKYDNGSGAKEATLTQVEIDKIAELAKLISKDEAVKVVTDNKQLYLDGSLNSTTATLSSWDDNYYWSINLRDSRPVDYSTNDYYRAYASARVDAKTGELISFHASIKSYWDFVGEEAESIDLKYSFTECRKRFEKFAKATSPEKFAETKQTSKGDDGGYVVYYDYGTGKSTSGGRSFTYTRYVNDIPFYSNSISGGVDRVTGKVYSYYANWSDVEFPSVDGAISAKEAYNKFLGLDSFELQYEISSKTVYDVDTYESTSKDTARLVYLIPGYGYIDPFSGVYVDYYGEPIEKKNTLHEYTDIEGTKYEKYIKLLASFGVGFEGDKYYPDKVITIEEFNTLFNNLYYLYGDSTSIKDTSKALTRRVAAQITVDRLNLEKMAGLNIYKLDYADLSKIGKKYEGYVALADGLGIFNVKAGGKFKPTAKVTRGEAAQIIVNTLNAYQKYWN